MCNVCGCSSGETRIEGRAPAETERAPAHTHHPAPAAGRGHGHRHDHGHGPESAGSHHGAADGGGVMHYGQGPAHAHAPGFSQARLVRIEQDILAKNDAFAAANRRRLEAGGTLALNLVSSPGSGKTTLLEATLERLAGQLSLGVIEGDQQTEHDAARIRATGAPAVQVNTGKGCHLDAHMVGHALDHLPGLAGGVLFIENVGNLVCPAGFDLGERHKVVILSVTEGEDKPLKYPDMFAASDLLVLTKIDLLPHLDFDVARCLDYARRINPELAVLELSARTGEGMAGWLAWVRHRLARAA